MKVRDMMQREVVLPHAPQRIISLVPSQTELLYDLGLSNRIVGRTKFCIHPKDKVLSATVVGGTKNFNFPRIEELQPDLIIGNKEENYEPGIHQLAEKYPVWMSDILTLNDALEMIRQVGAITATTEKAREIGQHISRDFSNIGEPLNKSCAYLIWKDPYMAVGHSTFINDMLTRLGLNNVLADKDRYPDTDLTALRAASPDFLFLSSEPYPFGDKHLQEFKKLLPGTKIILVDGEMFSWYGSRLLQSVSYMKSLMLSLKTD